uniref:Uncharacterized protein n=1 Tax=Vibrio phage Vc1 TaxID=1480731 RepID=A0A6M5CAZ8_9CAUD
MVLTGSSGNTRGTKIALLLKQSPSNGAYLMQRNKRRN